MAKKLQQFYIYKLSSQRIIQDKLNIQLNINDARKNGELISIGNSQLLTTIRQIKNRTDYEDRLNELLEQKKIAKKKLDNPLRLYEIEKEIDAILFVPEIISLVVEDNRHYVKIINEGLFVNGKKYVRLMCSAGQARRNNVLLIDSEIERQTKEILNNGRKDIPIVPAKFNAYFALSSSTALPVTTPLFTVVKDCEIKRVEKVEWVEEDPSGDDKIEEVEKELKFNLFDGQGLISPRMAKQWAEDLELDYIPSCFIVRSNFIKGLLVVVDFVEYSDYIGKHIIEDIYGDTINIRDMDVILSSSQFKLWNAFDNVRSYVKNSKQNNIGWGVTRYAPKQEKNYTTLNYQFIQALNLDDKSIKSLCKKTVEYFRNICTNTLDYTLLYLLGDLCDEDYNEYVFDNIGDNVTKAIILNNDLINDPYIQTHIQNSIKKKIKESYIGNLIVNGNYTFMVADPIAMLEHIFGLPVKGLLDRDEYYCKYWLDKGVNKIAGMRSPLVWRSEVDVMDLKISEDINHWFKYLNCCCVFPANGMDMAVLGGAD